MRRPLTAVIAAALVLTSVAPAAAVIPYGSPRPPGSSVYDYADYLFIGSGDCSADDASVNDLPDNFSCEGDWKFSDHREPNGSLSDTFDPAVANNPQEFYGVKGVGLNRAWEITTGRPDVVIAVLDSGIRWEEDRPDLLRKHYLNRGELPVPAGGPNPDDTRFDGYDVDGDADADGVPDGVPDGVFNVADYWNDPRVSDLNGNGVIDPEDLIRTFSDGVDDDGNGYVDDISGWDFLEDDNDPQDDVDYGHGTGEAEDSTAEAGFDDGNCPNCMVMSLRVGDSFIADVDHFAEAVVYAVDNGASVIQEALGTLNHTSFGQAAIDYAYRNGVIINASEADEAAGHHNWPAAYEHTMVVNSIRTPSLPTTRPYSYLYFNGCTNFGGYTFVSIPSTSCSSEATGRSSGVSGLLFSAAKNAVERGQMTNYIRDDGSEAPFPLSAEEAMQLWRLSADDIDFSSPCPIHPFCDDAPGDVLSPLAPPNNYATTHAVPSTRYQTVQGWDYFTGYGRSNAARLVRYIGIEGHPVVGDREYVPGSPYGVGSSPLTAQDRIPPEADITWPRRWHQYAYDPDTFRLRLPDDPDDPTHIVVYGRAAANRVTAEGGTFDYVLEWAPHVQGTTFPQSLDPAVAPPADSEERSTGPWFEAARVTGLTAAYEGELGRIPVADVAAALAATPNPFLPATDPHSPFQPERFAVRLRLRVIAHPVDPADTVNNEAIHQKQIDVYPAAETVIRDDLGVPLDGDDPGIADIDRLNVDARGRYSGGASSPAFHDLDGDGDEELIIATSDGVVHAFTDVVAGTELPGWPVTTDPLPSLQRHIVGDGATPVDNAYTRGEVTTEVYGAVLLGTPAIADLDDDGDLEVAIGDLEGKLYVWEHDGTRRPGFPVSVDRRLSEEPSCEGQGLAAGGDGICDDYEAIPHDGDPPGTLRGTADRVRDRWNARDWGINSAPAVGDLDPTYPGLEIVVGANDSHVYAWHADGTPVDGWPVVLRDPAKVAAMDPTTRFWTYTEDAGQAIGSKVLVSPSLGDLDGDGDLEVVIGVNEEYAETPNSSPVGDPLLDVLGAVVDSGNTRVYALHHTGAATPDTPESAVTPHLQDQAYLPGWPVPITLLVLDLLPYVGAGPNTQAVLFDADGDGTLEVAVASAAGPAYLLDHDGGSHLGTDPEGRYRTFASALTEFGPSSPATDGSTFVGVGALAVGSLDGGGHLTVVGPGAGVRRLLDVALEADQLGAEDHLLLWDADGPTAGRFEPNAPVIVNDLQFFTAPIVADITGDGMAEAIQGTAVSDTVAVGLAPSSPNTSDTAIRYFTGGWHVNAAAVGDAPLGAADDGRLHLASITREGYLRLWPTAVQAGTDAACVARSEWPEYGHDPFNSGNYHTDGWRPGPLREVAVSGGPQTWTVTFTAPGDDRDCGQVDHYELRVGRGASPPSWPDASPAGEAPATVPAGATETLTVTEPGASWLLVRARDDAGNGSPVAVVRLAPGVGPPGAVPPPAAPPAPLPTTGGGAVWAAALALLGAAWAGRRRADVRSRR